MKIAITGANSSVGQNLLTHLGQLADVEVIAGVRSERAFESLPGGERIQPRVIDYSDGEGLQQALAGADCVVHLAGILIESKHTNYASANVEATAAVVAAARAAGVNHIVFISVVGASPTSGNAYFRSKGDAEELVKDSGLSASIIRTPILLGPGSAGAASLLAVASRPTVRVLGGGHYSQRPLDIDDLINAIVTLCREQPAGANTYELVGPQAIAYRELISLTATKMGKQVQVGSFPIWLAKLAAAVSSTLKGGGMTPCVIDVITMDEVVSVNADSRLGIQLTPLEETLQKILPEERA